MRQSALIFLKEKLMKGITVTRTLCAPRTGAAIVVDTLNRMGVKNLFAHTGGAVIPLHTEFNRRRIAGSEIPNVIMMVHEQGAGHAAEGYARSTGEVGVALATSGPGATNLVTAIANAYKDSSPVVFITGQVGSPLIGSDAFQEVDVVGITRPICKHNFLVTKIEDLEEALVLAFLIAQSGRQGPVVVDICKDVFLATTDEVWLVANTPKRLRAPNMSKRQANLILDALRKAKRPVVIAGGGVVSDEGASRLLRTFVEEYQLPTVLTFMGLGAIPYDHRLFLGMPGMHGSHKANTALYEADYILAIGMRFDDRVVMKGFAKGKMILHVDIAAEEINKNVPTNFALVASAADFLLFACDPQQGRRTDMDGWVGTACGRDLAPPKARTAKRTFIDPVLAIETLAEQTDHTSIVVTDVGQHQIWTAIHYGFSRPRQWISSGGLATMGFGLPAAIGAAFAHPDRDIILVCGDGGFLMTSQELKVVSDHGLRIKIFLFNNGHLGMVRQWEDLPAFTDPNGSKLPRGMHHETCLGRNITCAPECNNEVTECTLRHRTPDFVILAKAFGIPAGRITKNRLLEGGIRTALAHEGPYVCELMIDRYANVEPMVELGGTLTQFVEFSVGD